MASRVTRWAIASLASAVLVALVTVLIKLLHPHGPAQGLAVLYILVVMAVAVRYGPAFAFVSAVLSVLAFDFFFLRPQQHFNLVNPTNAETVAAFLATALMAGLFASRLQDRTVAAARLATEQASLRRIASLVAAAAAPGSVLDAMAEELSDQIGAQVAGLFRCDGTNRLSLVAGVGVPADQFPTAAEPSGPEVLALTKSARFDAQTTGPDHTTTFGPYGRAISNLPLESGVTQPIKVAGQPWGFVVVAARDKRLPPAAERHVADYTELLATAIANAENRAELKASRVRIITAADETRRRIERDLHDGTQQRLVSLALKAGVAGAGVPAGQDQLAGQLADITNGLRSLLDEVREIARGVHPAALSQGGLAPALKSLARRSPVPVEVETQLDHELPPQVELTAYYVASELLTNVAKHARATVIELTALTAGDFVRLSIRDDGVGGADITAGSGLVGIIDRVSAIDGTLNVHSPVGDGTRIDIELPIRSSDT